MLKKILVLTSMVLIFINLSGCNKNNPLANKNGIENLVFMLQGEDNENWPSECELYYINPNSLRFKRHKEHCSEKSAQIYHKYKNHAGLAGATLADFRDSKVWEMMNAQYPSRSFR